MPQEENKGPQLVDVRFFFLSIKWVPGIEFRLPGFISTITPLACASFLALSVLGRSVLREAVASGVFCGSLYTGSQKVPILDAKTNKPTTNKTCLAVPSAGLNSSARA